MVDTQMLKERIKKSGLTVEQLSAEIGMDVSTFYRKMNADGKTFTIAQVDAIKNALTLDKATTEAIFFS